MIAALLALLTAAAPIKFEPPKYDAPKFDSPKIDLGTAIPKADGLSGPSQTQEPEAKQSPGGLRAPSTTGVKVAGVVNARDFGGGVTARKPVGRIEAFTVPAIPAKIPPFKTLVRLKSTDGIAVTVKTAVKSPAGEELLSSRAEAPFGSNDEIELVVGWDGFEATKEGDYKIVVTVAGASPVEFPLPVKVR